MAKDRGDHPSEGTVNGIPNHVIDSLVRSMLPMLREFYKTEEGKKAYDEWQAKHKQKHRSEKRQNKEKIAVDCSVID